MVCDCGISLVYIRNFNGSNLLLEVLNGVARTLKSYSHQRETTGSSSNSLQLLPFSKLELLLKERVYSQRERIISFKSNSLWYEKSLLHIR